MLDVLTEVLTGVLTSQIAIQQKETETMSLYKEKLAREDALTPPEGCIHFKTSKAMSGVNFFSHVTDTDYDFSFLQVYVNDELTSIPANSLTANAGDDIKIVSLSKPYPVFSTSYNNCISSIEEPFPLMVEDDGLTITSFSSCFYGCSELTSIPEGLFDNNPQVESFYTTFCGCSNLKAIPDGLFDNTPNVTNFGSCFGCCLNLIAIPDVLIDNTPNVTNFGSCFQRCSSITTIPDGLFNNTPNVTDFSYCFSNCIYLQTMPQN